MERMCYKYEEVDEYCDECGTKMFAITRYEGVYFDDILLVCPRCNAELHTALVNLTKR